MGFEESLIRNAAPTLAGIKVANLYNFQFSNLKECVETIEQMNQQLNQKGIYIELMKNECDFYLIYVYRKTQLLQLLDNQEVKAFLNEFGYASGLEVNLSSYLGKLKEKICSQECFPHEIGVFLGYPLVDVKAFIEQKGKGCILCGVWKVYHDVPSAMQCFCKLKKCKDVYVKTYSSGRSLYDMTVSA